MAFNLEEYETVASRIHAFYEQHPVGRIYTEMEVIDYANGFCVFKAYIYREFEDTLPSATGYCDGTRKDRGVDAQFWIPNAETSAIGRALATLGISAKGKRPSREEMAQVQLANGTGSTRPQKPILKEKFREPVKDAWTIENPKDVQEVVPVEGAPTLSSAMNLLADELNAKEIPQPPKCQHDFMIHKTGVSSKTGKPYEGYTCPSKNRAEQCPPIWL